jgi:hypothetical protein
MRAGGGAGQLRMGAGSATGMLTQHSCVNLRNARLMELTLRYGIVL